jgi:hypothetical protein
MTNRKGKISKDEALALARFRFAETMRFTPDRPKLDKPLSDFLTAAYKETRTAVTMEMVKRLAERGWLARPAAGQYVVTAIGLERMYGFIAKAGS